LGSQVVRGISSAITLFADLRIPCAVVAVDLKTAASCFKPRTGSGCNPGNHCCAGSFPAQANRDYQLVDGAVLNPVPVTVARLLAPMLPVVAISLAVMDDAVSGLRSLPLPVPVPAPIVERLTRTRVVQAFNIFLQSVDVSSRKLADMRL